MTVSVMTATPVTPPQGPSQGAQNYLPPPPESKIELWVPKSTVDTQILENTQENHIYHSLRRIGQNSVQRGGGRKLCLTNSVTLLGGVLGRSRRAEETQ